MKNTAKSIMSKNPVTVSANYTVLEVSKIMKNYNIGFLPVVENNDILGVVTDRDIVIRATDDNYLSKPIKDIMSKSPLQFVMEDTSISDVIFTMSNYKVRRVLVLNEDNLLSGIISLKDVILFSVENINNIANIFTDIHYKNM